MKRIILFLLPVVLVTACVDSLDDYNIDQKRAAAVPATTLFSNAVKNLSDVITTPNVNTNNFRLYVQQWSVVEYITEARYSMTARNIPENFWGGLYRDVLADLKESKRIVNADALLLPEVKSNQLAQIEVMEVYTWSVLVNTFGNVPYKQALDPKIPLPAYDDASEIYSDLLTRLDAAIAGFSTTATGITGSADILYAGNIEKWKKFSNSLKLKLAMVLADKDPGKAKTLVQQAAPNVITSNAENARHTYLTSSPNNNPLSNNLVTPFTTRKDFVAGKTIIDVMNTLNDPRRPFFFTTVGGAYVGGRIGFTNDYALTSHISDKISAPTFEALLLDYSEVQFLLAEAVERGFITGNAETYYNEAITASILYWGGTAAEATTYLAQSAVAYTTAAGDYKQKIGTQKWLALNNRGYDSWLEWRRLDYPVLLPPSGPDVPDNLKVPVRMIYPIVEQNVNGAQRELAAAAIGGDASTTKLFWDVN
ncbi:SusD/RagB family nutrient-binding outer membrane lipoprotein [Fulvivirgaceae bacterium PWU4]|uniref:SusD/RagB family nutrient-binding outer membrane lipoprotein n=1 Tax=Chryseosolibacter histidini TaxID=2782349 RepID=A0AAP2GKV5_9BACT|nr:SusD/RagB family nutrient-binding outer membrane lipoprotein [Chryseosolibacter histidini]MBT1699459.1 SusD/RagB family nutrient-binding outer membrane lipoprotein [Chryseosolibacter histidini]